MCLVCIPRPLGDTPALIAYAKRLGWSIEQGLDLCPKCAHSTYDEHDERRILNAIQDPIKRRLVELIFQYASDGPGLNRSRVQRNSGDS
jgi:hypothetical protein